MTSDANCKSEVRVPVTTGDPTNLSRVTPQNQTPVVEKAINSLVVSVDEETAKI